MKFVHCADVHLDSPLRGLDAYDGAPVERLRGATRAAFEGLIDLCIEEKASLLLLAGDLFDSDWRDFNTGLYFVEQMMRLERAGVAVALVRGNHDAESRVTRRLQMPGHVHCFGERKAETLRFEDLRVAVHGQSYATAELSDNLVVNYPPAVPGWLNIGMLHTALDGREGHGRYAPCSLVELEARGYDYWALGHVHQREVLLDQPWIVFPGCLQGRHIRETGSKGCYLVSAGGGRIESAEFRPLDVLRWSSVVVDASGVQVLDELWSRLRAAIEKAKRAAEMRFLAARVTISGQTHLHEALARDPESCREQARAVGIEVGDVWIEKVLLATTSTRFNDGARPAEDAIGELLRVVTGVIADEAQLAELSDSLAPLFDRLPSEVRLGEGGLDWRDPERMRALVTRAQALLLGRLTPTEPER